MPKLSKTIQTMNKTISKTKFRNSFTIAVYKDESVWVAHNLDFDIVGIDKDKDKAIAEMRHLTTDHIKFAIENGMLSSLTRPAPAEFWQLVSEEKVEQFKAQLSGHHISVKEVDTLVKDAAILEINSPRRVKERQASKTA